MEKLVRIKSDEFLALSINIRELKQKLWRRHGQRLTPGESTVYF